MEGGWVRVRHSPIAERATIRRFGRNGDLTEPSYTAICQEADHETCSDRPWAACANRCRLCSLRLLLSLSVGEQRARLRPGFLLPNRRRHSVRTSRSGGMLQAHRWTCGRGRQGTTAFHQFRTLKVQRFRQQLSDRPRLRYECLDLRGFLGGELAPPLGRRAAVDPA